MRRPYAMTTPATQQRAKRYEAIHNCLFVGETLYVLGLLVAFLVTGLSDRLSDAARSLSPNLWGATAIYGAAVVIATKLLFLPVEFYSGFILEHQFELSNQSLAGWLWDEVKSLGLNLLLGVVVFDVVYFLLRRAGGWWWVGAGGFFLVFGVVLSALFPVLILPLFYKLEPLTDETLKQKLVALAERVGAKVIGVYRLALSEKTKKANAAFAGLGATKRIILGDTLLEKFSADEIEAVLAHELAHYRHRDVAKLIAWGTMTTFVGLWLADKGLRAELSRFGFGAISDLGAFPLLAIGLVLFGLVAMPVNNAFSRWRERKADAAALDLTRNPAGFIGAMRKLAEQNLADLSPHPVVEFLLHDHPSLARRITQAEHWRAS